MNEPQPTAGPDRQLLAMREARRPQVPGHDPHPVTAHFGDRSVGIAVVHEPLGVRAEVSILVERCATHYPDHTVGGQSGVAIGQPAHRRCVQIGEKDAVRVGKQHEVVLRAMALDERDPLLHGRRC
jgi:hypothetical protein